MDLIANDKRILNLASINIIIGKNGCGKSTVLRKLDEYKSHDNRISLVKYITPERGGSLQVDSGIYDALQNNTDWGAGQRRRNRLENFRQISIAQFRMLENLVLRSIESNQEIRNSSLSFNDTIQKINDLLDNIKIIRGENAGFNIVDKITNQPRSVENLSSGESELISMAIEILTFSYQASLPDNLNKINLLLLDEPDVHLHPDLQVRLMKLLSNAVHNKPITIIIATHSTAILGALSQENAHVCFMKKEQLELNLQPIKESLQNILPIFGAHPLSNIFNQNPILLVEGEDDERIWQQVVRSSKNRIKLWPCSAVNKEGLEEYENIVLDILDTVYDNAVAFSLRDRDNDSYDISDKGNVTRFRLNCYAAENLLLSDDVLNFLGTNWEEMKSKIIEWLKLHSNHKKYKDMESFSKSYDRQNSKIKDLRLILVDLAGSNKPWEVIVGQVIASLNNKSSNSKNSLIDFLGPKLIEKLNLIN